MPLLTFPLVLALTTCFVVGSIVTWVLGERRRRLERDELEQQMTDALHMRSEVYDGVEKTVAKLVTKFDAMEGEFRERLGQGASARAEGEPGVRSRSSNPELWDLEREHQRVTSEHLAELSRRSARVAELMQELQSLEPLKLQLEGELTSLRQRHDNALANAAEVEQASQLRIQRLEARVTELEPLASMLEAAKRDLSVARQSLSAETQRAIELAQQLDAMAVLPKRVAELEDTLARRDTEVGDQMVRILELEGEFNGAQQALAKQNARCAELEASSKAAQQELASSAQCCQSFSAQLDETRAALEASRAQAQSAQQSLEQSKARSAELESELLGARGQLQATGKELEQARAELVLHSAKLAARSSHVVEAWSVLSELKPMLETLEQKLKESDEPQAALPRSEPAARKD